MEANNPYINHLFQQYLEGRCSEEDLDMLFAYFKLDEDLDQLRELIQQQFDKPIPDTIDQEEVRIRVARIGTELEQKINMPVKIKRFKWWYGVAAAILLTMTISLILIQYNRTIVEQEQHISASDIKPGSYGATLTLSNGKKISLTEQNQGQLAEESGIKIIKSEDGQLIYQIESTQENVETINTMETAPGQTYTIVLPDKSKVWLNAASSITYSTSIGVFGEERKVQLKGEAYFEIAKNEAKPFIVKTSSQEVKVLGTHFNINSYSSKVTTTTLAEGSVLVSPSIASISKQKLKPGQKSILSKSSLNIVPANIEADLAWKNGLFTFDDATVTEVMQQISRWYNIEVAYSGAVPDERINGGISRQSDLNAVLKMFELININYKLERTSNGIKLIITP